MKGLRPPTTSMPSGPARWPSWNTATSTPKVADSDTTFITRALSGDDRRARHQEQQDQHGRHSDADREGQAGFQPTVEVCQRGRVSGHPGLHAGRAVRPELFHQGLRGQAPPAALHGERHCGQVRVDRAGRLDPEYFGIAAPPRRVGVEGRGVCAGHHLHAGVRPPTALAHGIPITEVSRWLGHRSIEVTYRIYGHLVPSSWDRAHRVLDQAFLDSTAQDRTETGAEPVLTP
jgi:hypothetical protein